MSSTRPMRPACMKINGKNVNFRCLPALVVTLAAALTSSAALQQIQHSNHHRHRLSLQVSSGLRISHRYRQESKQKLPLATMNSRSPFSLHVAASTSFPPAEDEAAGAAATSSSSLSTFPSSSFGNWWNEQELKLMFHIQNMPRIRSLSLAVHYSLTPQVVTPALAMIAWLVSLSTASSLICLVCSQDVVNTAIKWAVQRPRPHCMDNAEYDWEKDFSFPSAHTQFFSGLVFGACTMSSSGSSTPIACLPLCNTNSCLLLASVFGLFIGMTRVHLGVHWPSDTLFGLLCGAACGILWGMTNPYGWILHRGSPILSIAVATAMTGGLTLLLVSVRFLVKQRHSMNDGCENVDTASSIDYDAESATSLHDPAIMITNTCTLKRTVKDSRLLRSKISVLVTLWCTLAYTAFVPAHLPTAMMEPMDHAARFTQATIGLGGMAGFGLALKRLIVRQVLRIRNGTTTYSLLKGLAYAGICAWTFLLSQLASHRVLDLFG